MSKGQWRICWLGLVLASAFLFLPREPSYQGKGLTYWLEQFNRAGSKIETQPSAEAIRAMGSKTLPHLLRYIEAQESPWRTKLCEFLSRHKLAKFAPKHPARLRGGSIYALTLLGDKAEPILSKIRFCEDDTGQSHGEEALQFVGPIATNALIHACESTNQNVRIKAALMFVKATQDGLDRVQWIWDSGIGLAHMTVIESRDMQALGRNLNHPSPAVRQASEDCLRYWSLRGQGDMRHSAIKALTEIDPEAASKASFE